MSPSRRPAKRTDMKSTPTWQASSSKQQINDELPLSNSSIEQDGQVVRWRDLTTDQKWDYQFKHLVEYKENEENLSMPRKYTIKYDDGKVINIGKWLDNMKSAERSKHLDKKWLEQLENIGLFGSKTDDASNGAVGPSTGNIEHGERELLFSYFSGRDSTCSLLESRVFSRCFENHRWSFFNFANFSLLHFDIEVLLQY